MGQRLLPKKSDESLEKSSGWSSPHQCSLWPHSAYLRASYYENSTIALFALKLILRSWDVWEMLHVGAQIIMAGEGNRLLAVIKVSIMCRLTRCRILHGMDLKLSSQGLLELESRIPNILEWYYPHIAQQTDCFASILELHWGGVYWCHSIGLPLICSSIQLPVDSA